MSVATEFAEIIEELEHCARAVQLKREPQLPLPPDASSTPPGTGLWIGTYAVVLLWPVSTPDEMALQESFSRGQTWLDAFLTDRERTARRLLDGYLLLALPSAPDQGLWPIIRDIELDTAVCRKHVLWLVNGGIGDARLQRILAVTVLGLPASPAAAGVASAPSMTSEECELLDRLVTLAPTRVAEDDLDWKVE